MKKIFIFFLFLAFLSFLKPVFAYSQNKAGINIAANHHELEKAAEIVGPGGWVVIMACPSDGDKIASFIASHPQINVVVRGHFAGNTPNADLAKSWAATLASIPSTNKIYFVPWNEPNQAGTADYATPEEVVGFVSDLTLNFQQTMGSSWKNKVILLSPMMNQTHYNFSDYVHQIRAVKSSFFGQFDGIAFSLYDLCDTPLTCDSKYLNPLKIEEVLGEMGATGKPIFGIEAGTAGNNFYWKMAPSAGSPLFQFVDSYLDRSPGSVKMFAIPSYDLAGEVGHSWSLFDPPDVANLLRSAPDGGTTSASGVSQNITMKKCPGRNYTFYENSESECIECGGSGYSLLSCLPLSGEEYGEEYSKETLKISETVGYQNDCTTVNFTGKLSASNVSIPFARNLNLFFIGPYMDNLAARVAKQNPNPIKDYGVIEKIASVELQDDLRLKFLSEITNGHPTRYSGFNIQGVGANELASRFKSIDKKRKERRRLTENEEIFLKKIWPQVPLFANEETDGEIIFEGSGISGSIKTSIPEVYRLDKVTQLIAQMLGLKNNHVAGEQVINPQVLAKDCEKTPNLPKIVSDKETLSGPSDPVCTDNNLQENPQEIIEGERTYDHSDFDTRNMGGCEGKPPNGCCGTGGKCLPKGDLAIPGVCSAGECNCKSCDSEDFCYSGSHYPGCEVPKPEKTFDIDISIKNRVPFLKRISENTVGPNGIFRIFVPLNEDSSSANRIISHAFREVAGESKASLEMDNFQVKSAVGVEIDPESSQDLITLLFHKLGTVFNAKNLVAGMELWPFGQGGTVANPDPFSPAVSDITNFETLFETIGNTIGVPPKILAAIMQIESPSTYNLTAEQINTYSQPEVIMPGCGPNECSATGPMQMTTGIDRNGSPSCSECCWKGKCLTECPNQWSVYGQGNPCNLADNITAAAKKLKHDSGATSMDWTREQVYEAAYHYYGNCTVAYERLGNRTYCEFVWWYYTAR